MCGVARAPSSVTQSDAAAAAYLRMHPREGRGRAPHSDKENGNVIRRAERAAATSLSGSLYRLVLLISSFSIGGTIYYTHASMHPCMREIKRFISRIVAYLLQATSDGD